MIGVIILTHQSLDEAFRTLTQHFFPDIPDNIRLLGVKNSEDHDDVIRQINQLMEEINADQGVLVLTDIFGATPCNAARKLVIPNKTAMLTGLNVPMMIKAIQHSGSSIDLAEFTAKVKQAAINGIIDITSPNGGVCSS
ncbi:PTS sugar transporter subunit IIA [Neisseria canis]|uniref:PTS system, IIAB component n=1 Tax=Neisseria canis TaxID=493 RepID=A0A448D583_9NEIS|nr:PTS mannose transporter subunit IIA [Neisseria canis]OSI12431.1 PTS mannose transporter subunit IIA [Neisseria canis]VEE99051.1 PTS system, IIAB component [Neisseria canis]